MDILPLLVHWIHVFSAICAIGGLICLRMVVVPLVAALEGEAREGAERNVTKRGTKLVMHSTFLLILTGFFNMMFQLQGNPSGVYVTVLMSKFMLALGVLVLVVMMFAPSESLAKFQEKRPLWMTITILLGIVVVLLSAILRSLPAE